jgi:hypothetical protein
MMNRLVLLFSLLFQMTVYAVDKECSVDSKSCVFTGSLELHTYPGLPNYEDIKKGDEAETGLYLKLDQPMVIRFIDYENKKEIPAKESISLMHIAGEFDEKRFFKLAKEKNHVTIDGTTFEWQFGHHHTHFLITPKKISVDKK